MPIKDEYGCLGAASKSCRSFITPPGPRHPQIQETAAWFLTHCMVARGCSSTVQLPSPQPHPQAPLLVLVPDTCWSTAQTPTASSACGLTLFMPEDFDHDSAYKENMSTSRRCALVCMCCWADGGGGHVGHGTADV